MILIIGLNNKGKEFNNTYHNIGKEFVFSFVENQQFNSLSENKKLNALISQNSNIILAVPQCFMNESGRIVRKLIDYFSVPLDNVLIVHDDTDILLGNFKLQKNRGAAGHKGIESIIDNLHSKNFWRLRIGVRNNFNKETARTEKAKDLVLKKFSKIEKEKILEMFPKTFDAINLWIKKQNN
ncbi:MAG: aminoacyl-tRNA hydrolase [Parcubacteria group bacterium]|nr:aminoacyl-tRNA hydrolase [Parcubacteria group bacterium]HRU36004.1 aminoacyl-tRNA hydrolase [Candidatus Paceibacterota bacterium]